MKNFYFLTTFLLISFAYGQNLLANGDLETWTDTTTPTNWIKYENIEQEATEKHGGMYSAKHTGGTKDLAQTINGIIVGNSYNISIWYKVAPGGDGSEARIWSYWQDDAGVNITDTNTDGALRGPDNGYLDNNNNEWTEYTATVTAPANASKLNFELRTYSGSVVYWDDLSVTCTSCGTDPSVSILTPANNAVLPLGTTSYTMTVSVSNFNMPADGHYHVYLDGTDLGNNAADGSTSFELTNLTPGEHTLKVQLKDPNHANLSTDTFAESTFTIPEIIEVSDLAALRAHVLANGLGNYYKVTGEVFVSYIVEDGNTGVGTRNQKYVQDANGGLLLDDTDNTLDPNAALAIGDGLTNLVVKTGEYVGVLQGNPQSALTASSNGNTIMPVEVTVADYNANAEMYESRLIKFSNVTFADSGTTVVANNNYNLNQGSDTVATRSAYDASSIIGVTLPSEVISLVVIGAEFNGTPQPNLRSVTDINLGVDDIKPLEDKVLISNTLVRDNFFVALDGKAVVEIFNMNGQLIKTEVGEDKISINASSLNPGAYLVRISQDGEAVTKKIIKQ